VSTNLTIVILAALSLGQWAITAWLTLRRCTACLDKLPQRQAQRRATPPATTEKGDKP